MNIGGHFKGKNPTAEMDTIIGNWVENTKVLYIGKAGGNGGNETLNTRLRCYMKFGQGKAVSHWGGRYIWQLCNAPH